MSSSAVDFSLIAAGVFLAALVIGSAGFAFAIVVTGFWIHVLPPPALVLLAAICATLLSRRRKRSVAHFRLGHHSAVVGAGTSRVTRSGT